MSTTKQTRSHGKVSGVRRDAQRQLENNFAGGGERISVSTLPPASEIANLRSGIATPAECPWMLPCNADLLRRNLKELAAERFNLADPVERETFSQKIRESFHNKQVEREIADYRQFVLQYEILASQFALAAFQNVPLGANETPMIITPSIMKHFNVRYVGQQGQSRRDQFQDTASLSQILMRMLATDKIEYPLFDIQIGKIETFDKINTRIQYDMDMKIDIDAEAQLVAGIRTNGLRALLNLHPSIVAANVPDKNYLDLRNTGADDSLDGSGNDGILTINKVKKILNHLAAFGVDGITPDGGFQISSIVQSPQNLRDWWNFVDLTSNYSGGPYQPNNVVPRPVREQIFNTGFMGSAWGYNWTTKANARLAKGRMYVFSNQPVGWFFTKPEFDAMLTWDGVDQQERNEGHVMWRRVLQFAMPDLWLHRYIVVDF